MTAIPLTVEATIDLIWHDYLTHHSARDVESFGWEYQYRRALHHPAAVQGRLKAKHDPVLLEAYNRWQAKERRNEAVNMMAQIIREVTVRDDAMPKEERGRPWFSLNSLSWINLSGVMLEAYNRVSTERGIA